MGDSGEMNPNDDGEQHLFVAAQHVLKALSSSKNVSDDMRKSLIDLEYHLSMMTQLGENDAKLITEIEDQLKHAQGKILSWQSSCSMVWDSGPQESAEFLLAVQEVQKVIDSLENLLSNRNGRSTELLNQAHIVLQMAMARLEQELIHILAQNRVSIGPLRMYIHSCDEGIGLEDSVVLNEDDSVEGTPRRENSCSEPEEYVMDLILPDAISDIKSIAKVMFASNFDKEFCQSFVTFWKDSLDEYMIVCQIDRLGVEDVFKMEWSCLSCRISNWCRAMLSIFRFYLVSEKRLFDQIFEEFKSIGSNCFVETLQASMMCLLNFGEAAAIGPHPPERLFRLIDMYEVLADLLQDINVLFSEGSAGSFLRIEFHELLRRLSDSVKLTFMKFEKHVASDRSMIPFQKGGIHPLTKYVMNYINLLADYGDTLNSLLEELNRYDLNQVIDDLEDQQPDSSTSSSSSSTSYILYPMTHHLWSVMSILKNNLDSKSKLYDDRSLMHIFMMNNIHYMVKKVKSSKIGTYLGNEWILGNVVKFRLQAANYVRVTWSPVLSLIKNDGEQGKSVLKERIKSFNASFEDTCKSQTGWHVFDPELRENLKISILQRVIPAYRCFFDTVASSIGEKHIKYTADDLENYIFGLFEGSNKTTTTSSEKIKLYFI